MLDGRPLAGSVPIANLTGDVFEPDLAEAGRVAARLVIEQNASNVAYVHREARGWNERFRGFREAWIAAGRSEGLIRTFNLASRSGAPSDARIDGLILDQSELLGAALRASPALAAAPATIVGLGETGTMASLAEQTTVQYGGEEIGRRAAHALLQRVEQGREDPPQFVRVAPRVLQREPVLAAASDLPAGRRR